MMRKFFVFAAIFAVLFAACEQSIDNSGNKLTIRNDSSFDLTNVVFSNVTFSVSGSNDLPKTGQVSKQRTADDSFQTGCVNFSFKGSEIVFRTWDLWNIEDEDTFRFYNDKMVVEMPIGNNAKTLSEMATMARVAVERGGLSVVKDETVDLDRAFIGYPEQIEFTLTNTGVGNLILTGNEPIKITGATDVFSVVKPSGSEINPNKSLSFKINFDPKEEQNYNATVTINSNNQDGDFSFNITAKGMPPKPVATVMYEGKKIPQLGTISAEEVLISLSKSINVTIKNDGKAVLSINTAGITITGTGASVFEKINNPNANIPIGGQTSFAVECKPVSVGENRATLTIPNDDDERNPIVVYLAVIGVKGEAIPKVTQAGMVIGHNSVTPFDFETIEVNNSSQSFVFSIENTGNIDLVLTGNPLLIESINSVFAVTTEPTSKTISPGGAAVSFVLRYTPITEGEDLGKIILFYNDTEEFIINVTGTGHMKKPQIGVYYGNTFVPESGTILAPSVLVSYSATFTVIIKNDGDAPLTVNTANISITGTDAGAFTRTTTPASSIAADGQSQFVIQFTPTRVGEHNASLMIPTNDTLRTPYVVHLKASGEKGHAVPELKQGTTVIENGSLTPIDFRVVELSSYKDLAFDLKNIGNIPLELTGSPLLIASSDTAFVPVQPTTTTIAPNGTMSFIIRYTPTEEREEAGIITIASNSDDMLFTFRVKGTGHIKKPQITVSRGNNTTNRTVVVDMYDYWGDGWNGNAALRINVNEIDIATTKVQNGHSNTYSFMVAEGDIVQVYWVAGHYQEENSFVMYYADTPPNPIFTISSWGPTTWSGNNALIYRLRDTMDDIRNGTLLGSFTVLSGAINQNDEYDFGTILFETGKEITFAIGNVGDANLTFAEGNPISLADNSGNHFGITVQPSSAASVSPGNSTTFTLRFNPKSVGTNFTAIVQIKTNSRNNADFSFRIKGTGRSYAIGDEGPGGGLIFFAEGGQFKECSGDLGFGNWNAAMTTAQNYGGGGFSNWYLPDRSELVFIALNIHFQGMGGFYDSYYWSSDDNGGTDRAARLDFSLDDNKGWEAVSKTSYNSRIIAVRSFSL